MTDKKISQLTAATTPLAGTEVLPIVQSAATVKVATDDLTVKNVRSNATSGILQIVGPGAGATRTMTVPNANFTAARTDAAQSFTGDQTLSTGNLVVGTAGKGIDFSVNSHAAGMTSELLTWYEEGTWTPKDGASATLTQNTAAYYTRIGRLVTLFFDVSWTANTIAIISNFPFTSGSTRGSGICGYQNTGIAVVTFSVVPASTYADIFNGANVAVNPANSRLVGIITYQT